MKQKYDQLNTRLAAIIHDMQKIQKGIAADPQPASMHELDRLMKLGAEYGEIVGQLAGVEKTNKDVS